MYENELVNAICNTVNHIHNIDSLKRIYNVVSWLLRHDE